MIYFFLCFNRQAKVRLSKWFEPYEDAEKNRLVAEIHKIIMQRPTGFTNFVDFRDRKIVYRRYAGLYFSVCVDREDNELALLELVHLFVECLDRYFHSVCELDLVFNFHKCYQIMDEVLLGGEPVETSKGKVLARMEMLDHQMKDHKKKRG